MKNLLFIIFTLILPTVVFASEPKNDLQISEASKIFEETVNIINEEYVGEYTNRQLLDNALSGMTSELDPYSYYLSENYIKENYSSENINYEIGVDLKKIDNKYFISKIYDNSPISKFNVTLNDEVIALNQYSISSLSETEIADILYNKPMKIKNIKLKRENEILSFDIPFTFTPTVFLLNEENNVITIKIKEFQLTTSYELNSILCKIHNSETKNLIIDIRDNGGGYIHSLNEVINLLVPAKETYSITYNNGSKDTFYSDGQDYTFKKIIVIVNENTASSAEVFAGVIKENNLGTIVGTLTYGKGTSQDIISIGSPNIDYYGAIKLTTGIIFINNKSYNKLGIQPDISIPLPKYVIMDSEYYYNSLNTTFEDNIKLILKLGNYSTLKDFKIDHGLESDNLIDQKTMDSLNAFREELLLENDFQLEKAKELL